MPTDQHGHEASIVDLRSWLLQMVAVVVTVN